MTKQCSIRAIFIVASDLLQAAPHGVLSPAYFSLYQPGSPNFQFTLEIIAARPQTDGIPSLAVPLRVSSVLLHKSDTDVKTSDLDLGPYPQVDLVADTLLHRQNRYVD